jgi:hypothetical protein
VIDADVDVRDRLPDRAERGLDIVEVLVGIALNVLLYFIGAAIGLGYATGKLSLGELWILAGLGGPMAVCYVIGRVRGDADQQVAALVTAGEFVVYVVFGVAIAVLSSPADQFVSWVGVVLAGLLYVRYGWLTTRLGFEEDVGEEVAA